MHHPDVEAVSVGAILSTYQRVRVEHVSVSSLPCLASPEGTCSCRRLGLTPLSYLWQRDQGELLQEMVDCGVNAILIKVAGIGLKPHHLGQSLAQMQPVLQKLVRWFLL
jgi:diphthine-ammonia ligase